MKLQLLMALAAASVCACSSSADETGASPSGGDAGASSDAAADAAVEVLDDASDDASTQDAAPSADAAAEADVPDASASLAAYERACALLHGCLGVDGLRQCMLYAQANRVVSAQELSFGVAMQSIVMQGSGVEPRPTTTLYLPSIMDCVAAAEDCDAVRACVGGGTPCDPETYAPACEGETLRYCLPTAHGGVVARTRCAEAGLQCVASNTPMGAVAQCAHGPCDMGTAPTCDGLTAKNCMLGGWIHQPCEVWPGTQCALVDAMGMQLAQCEGDGAACDETHVPTCEGDALVICQAYKLYTMECPPGGACGVDPASGAGACWASTLFCGDETCEGSTLSYCAEGEPRALDCTALGFTGCVAEEGSARCVP